jgi:mRNA-degrading endonuclease RelE of RelBE toxin-antitoxin system
MTYEVKLSEAAEDDWKGFAGRVQGAILNTMRGDLTKRPDGVGVALVGKLAGCRSLTRGTYRIVYKVTSGEVQILSIRRR